jgi:hypothetical protein
LIKAGESLEQAKAREEKSESDVSQLDRNVDLDSWNSIDVNGADQFESISQNDSITNSVNQVRDPIVEVRPYDFPTEIVADPDFVVSPAEALEEARRRIAQMRASLQTNVNRVSQSFEHPIFASAEVPVAEVPPFLATDQTEVPKTFESLFDIDADSLVSPPKAPSQQSDFAQRTSSNQESQRVETVKTEIREEPRVFTQTTQQSSPTIIIDEAADQTHSLELVIMRDEIKDLRNRLDSSQKLIENLMVRLADLAELALKRRD